MCCSNSGPKGKQAFFDEFFPNRRKTVVLWKRLGRDGCASYVPSYQYGPGAHRLRTPVRRYNTLKPRGYHVYTRRPSAYGGKVVPVVCRRDDFVRTDYDPHFRCVEYPHQAVFDGITVRKKDWEAAFGKVTKKRKARGGDG